MLSQAIKQDVRIPAVFISLLLSWWCVSIDPVINNDGFLYVLLADLVQDGDYFSVLNIFRWPFYSFLIAGLSNLTGLATELTAYYFNAILIIVIIFSYLSIVKLLGGDHRVLIIAGIIILLFPGINRYRSFINRDFGYLAFYMLSLLVFFKHIIKPEWYWPVVWTIFLAMAALFRIEALALLIFFPFISRYVFAESKNQRIRIGVSFLLVLAGSFLLFSWWFAGNHLNKNEVSGFGDVYNLVKSLLASSATEYDVRLNQMRILLTQYSQNYAPAILMAAFIIILLSEIIRSITLPYFILVIYGWKKYLKFSDDRIKNAWILLIAVQLIILSGAMLKYFFLTGRFPLALSLTVLLVIPFIISKLYREWAEHKNRNLMEKWFFPAVVTVALVLSFQGLNTFTSKNYFKEGGLWIKQNIKSDEYLLSTDSAVTYYAGRNPYKQDDSSKWISMQPAERNDVIKLLQNNQGKNFKFIAISVKEKYKEQEKEIVELLGRQPEKRFKNKFGDELLIFRNS